jgi:predicted GNAT family acetyltransferase
MEIRQNNNNKNGYFEATDGENQAGKLGYVWAGEQKFIIDHTQVNEAYNGQGVGKKLVMKAVEYARENNLKIIPLCPFAKSVFDRTGEIRDVL